MNIIIYGGNETEKQQLSSSFMSIGLKGKQVFVDRTEAIKRLLMEEKFDMVIIDGDDATYSWTIPYRDISALENPPKVVLLSRWREQAVQAYEKGIFDFLLKPVKQRQLKRVLEKLEKSLSLEREAEGRS